MHDVRFDHVEQTLIVGNDDGRCLGRVHLVHAISHDAHGIDIQTRVGLVKDRELWLEHVHLEDLVAFLLAAAETLVHRASCELAVKLHHLALLVHELHKLGSLKLRQSLILTLLVHGSLEEVGHRHARNLYRILEREKQSLVCAVLWLHVEQVLAVEQSHTLGHLIERVACEHGAECRLARTVRTHDGMDLAIIYREVDASKYFLIANLGVEVLYF